MENNAVFKEIVNDSRFLKEKEFMQHGNTSVYEHSIYVATTCAKIVKKFNIKVDEDSLIKGALLHDYFLYDWHVSDKSHRLHGFTHPKTSWRNAKRDFGLNKVEENMILSHMFPMVPKLPKHKESWILTVADKYCATREIIDNLLYKILPNRS
jgi:uncharacterized protein